jgi:hypothetical protein
MKSIFLLLTALASLPSLAGAAQAKCKDPYLACTAISQCLFGNTAQNDLTRITTGISQGNGQLIYDGTQACQKNASYSTDMDKAFAACTNPEYVTIGGFAQANQHTPNACFQYPEDTGSLPMRYKYSGRLTNRAFQ